MILNYILIAFRSFRQQKSYTFLNVMGLSLGMAASVLIFQYVKYERSFDQFHSRARDIYRIQCNSWQDGQPTFESAVAVPAVGPALKNNFPEVEAYTRLLRTGGVVRYEAPGQVPTEFREERAFFADTSLFRIFDFKLVRGSDRTCLKGVNNVIISQSVAKKYFGSEEALGRRLSINDRDGVHRLLEVTGVFADVPENSHIKFDFLVSFATLNAWSENESETSWDWPGFYTFVLLKPDTDLESLQSKWNSYVIRTRAEEWKKTNSKQRYILQPLKDIHLYSNLRNETSPKELRDGNSVHALSLIATIILVIAWVNYVNLATARSFKRANEVGVRKVVGASKSQLIGQFLTESLIMNVAAVVLAVFLVRTLWHPFVELAGWDIPISFMFRREFWMLITGLFLAGSFVSGLYPAIVLSSFKPVSVLKGKLIRSSTGNYLRKGLVVFQFAASVFLISGSLIVYDQLMFMKNRDLGININETMVLKGPLGIDSLYDSKYEAFKTEVLRIPGVKGITASYIIPGEENWWLTDVQRLQSGPGGVNTAATTIIDEDHIPQYEMKVVAGRNFSKEFREERNVLINESLLKELQFETPGEALGQKIVNNEDTVEIVGVVADFHQMSLKKGMMPYVFRYWTTARFYSIKLEGKPNYKDVIANLEGPWKTIFPGNPVDYFFLDQFFNKQYERDDRFGKVFTIFTVLAILLASMGLLGLASFMTLQRTREIGIRKVMGSSVSGVILLLTKEFIQPVFIAIAVALPLGWWLMNEWLQTFAYHIAVRPLVFLISGILVVVIAFISVSSQTLKAALARPAETLRHE